MQTNVQYKTVVTDYEGMQGVLDMHSAQGWRLFSLTPDTYRKSAPSGMGDGDASPFDELATHGAPATQEYSASYYLLVFQRDDTGEESGRLASLEEAFPVSSSHAFEN